jgi:serine/threonine-protein phosphatase 4 regulatory subunit 1
LYCRICASVGLAIRFSDVIAKAEADKTLTPDQILQDLLESAGSESNTKGRKRPYVPFQSLAADERKHLLRLLGNELIPPALEMKDDRVTNVRLTLMKCLHLMPDDVRNLPNVSSVLHELDEESETWESVYGTGEATLMSVVQSASGPIMVSVVSPDKPKETEKESNPGSRIVQQRVSAMEKSSRKRSKKSAEENSGPVAV